MMNFFHKRLWPKIVKIDILCEKIPIRSHHHLRFKIISCRRWIWIKLLIILGLHQIFPAIEGFLSLFFCCIMRLANPFFMTIFRRFLASCIGWFSRLKNWNKKKLFLMMKMKRMAQIIYFWKILILYQKASEIDRSRWLEPNVW